jgi:hypothetical protein
VVDHQGCVRLDDQKPTKLAAGLAFQQAFGTPEPSIGKDSFATEGAVIHGQGGSHARRAAIVSSIAVQPVGALAQGEDRDNVVQPPGRGAEALKSFRRLLLGESRFKENTRFLPRSPSERRLSSAQGVILFTDHNGSTLAGDLQ